GQSGVVHLLESARPRDLLRALRLGEVLLALALGRQAGELVVERLGVGPLRRPPARRVGVVPRCGRRGRRLRRGRLRRRRRRGGRRQGRRALLGLHRRAQLVVVVGGLAEQRRPVALALVDRAAVKLVGQVVERA